MKEIKDAAGGRIRFKARIQPSSPRNELLGWTTAGELRFRVAAPPREGEANAELVRFIAKRFGVAKREIEIESGLHSRTKLVSAPAAIRPALLEIGEE